MKKFSLFIPLFLFISTELYTQVSINTDGTQPDPSAGLELKFINKGFLLPRLSNSQIQAIPDPADGLQVYCTTDSKIYIYAATVLQWREVAYGPGIISPSFLCGYSVIINHVAGVVAPVTKTVTYGTVNNIPGEPSKCWITSNLGADHQATAVNDATEASAGWYWQFNRKQGYKHDGTSRTPNTAWITMISEDFDWQSANDPCFLEIGSDWRLPTYSEWFNVDNTGNWINRDGPWTSGLKMHSAGYIYSTDGSMTSRGNYGHYWSANQGEATKAGAIFFGSGFCSVGAAYAKATGNTVRCLNN